MIKKTLFAVLFCLSITSSIYASSGFYCEETEGSKIFLISTNTVVVISANEEEKWIETELSSTMRNNYLSMRLENMEQNFQLILNIQEEDLSAVASLKKNAVNNPNQTITGEVYYQREKLEILCELRNTILI